MSMPGAKEDWFKSEPEMSSNYGASLEHIKIMSGSSPE